jgi:hypothetical protein
MTYTVKEKNNKFYIYNTNSKRMLTKGYDSVISAKAAVKGLNNRSRAAKSYHQCCASHSCGKKKKNKKKVMSPSPIRTIPVKKKKKKRRVALTQVTSKVVNNVGSLKGKSSDGQRRAYKYLTSAAFEAKAKRLDAKYNKTVF